MLILFKKSRKKKNGTDDDSNDIFKDNKSYKFKVKLKSPQGQ